MRTGTRLLYCIIGIVAIVATACPVPGGVTVPSILMSPRLEQGYFSLPWPNDIRRDATHMTDWSQLPGITTNPFTEPLPPFPILAEITNRAAQTVNQFGLNTAVYFQSTVEIAPSSLPSPLESTDADASVQLINLDTGVRAPVVVVNQERADRWRPAHLLTVLPYPGHPLDADADYAAVVFDTVQSTAGVSLTPAGTLAQLRQAYSPTFPMSSEQHARLGQQLGEVDTIVQSSTSYQAEDIVGFTVYHTQDPTAEFDSVLASLNELPRPQLSIESEGTCANWGTGVSQSLVVASLTVPQWRSGTFPYLLDGGEIVVDANGRARQFGTRSARVNIMVPCIEQPLDGFPVASFVNGTGADLTWFSPLVNSDSDYPMIRAEIAPLYGIDQGDVEGLMNLLGFTTPESRAQLLFYNVINPAAIRSNPIQQAADHLLLNRALSQFSVDLSAAGGPGIASAHPTKLVATGHSQGAQTLPLVAYGDPTLEAVISSSGSGGQYHSLAHGPRRLSTISLVTNDADRLDEIAPIMQLVQTAIEASDGSLFPNSVHYLNWAGYSDTCVAVEAATHLAAAQHLGTVDFAPLTTYGEPTLDRTPVTTPVQGNVGGATRVSVVGPGGHFNSEVNTATSTAFARQALEGVAPTVDPPGGFSFSDANCAGQRFDNPPNMFGV